MVNSDQMEGTMLDVHVSVLEMIVILAVFLYAFGLVIPDIWKALQKRFKKGDRPQNRS
jgi:hypothetical protein